ncbi:hypothetical protein VOLCADRAFT_115835 [Volvox carteri f. nagariensis]|uniref:Uncharacterized protein n=1 Tax=Volvox carteri f. nagariensis TaxID=3068 RepID=D8TIK7_VOLCA|nr:uncharacterized protein VOLCADRAFT_115835 [Volvox carteri f. nagariensis]EFJ53261.1 hypothetical protein VOLCADRAFT_115835 [Volvox carteri f. nagariensis]|eukprot:XP_002946266.1 hypothetical protein VOLCADRAFT_115835 [Volvox carteri f. nagariensis]
MPFLQASSSDSATSAGPQGPLGTASHADLSQARVAVVSIPACPYCKKAKDALTRAGIPYVDVNVASDQSLRQLVRDITGSRTVPQRQIFVAGRSVGGCDDLLAQLADGTFAKAMAMAEATAAAAVPPGLLESIRRARLQAEAEARVRLMQYRVYLLACVLYGRWGNMLYGKIQETKEDQADATTSLLADLRKRLVLPESQGGISRREQTIGSHGTFKAFSLRQLIEWISAAGSGTDPRVALDPRVIAMQLLDANYVVPAALDPVDAGRIRAVVVAAAGEAVLASEELATTRATALAAAAAATGTQQKAAKSGKKAEALEAKKQWEAKDEEKEQQQQQVLLTLPTEVPQPPAGKALNTQFWWQGPARPPNEVAASLRNLILELYDKHLSKDGRSLSYGALRSDPNFATFVASTAELQKVDISPLSREELMSFGINLYNALIIHALVALNLTQMSAAQRATFFSRTAKYNIGGLDYSADDLEHGLLRGDRAGAGNLFNVVGLHGLAGPHWRMDDPRRAKVVSPVDPRIHFALVCGAKSCPPIKLYTPSNLEEGLAAAAEAFCANEVQVDQTRREVKLSKIFKWYAIDFGQDKYKRLSYIASFLSEPVKGELLEMVRQAQSGQGDVRLAYQEYDWSLNGTD